MEVISMKYLKTVLAAVLAISWNGAVGLSQSAPPEDSPTLYQAGKIYTLDGPPLEPGMMLVAGGNIAAIGESLEVDAETAVVDLGADSVIMPGLVDAYSQAGLENGQADEISREMTPGFSPAHSIDWEAPSMRNRLAAGTTTVAVFPGHNCVLGGTACIVKTCRDLPPGQRFLVENGALVAHLCSDPTSRNSSRRRPDSIYVRLPTNRMGVVWLLRSNFDHILRNDAERLLVNNLPDDETVSTKLVKQALLGERQLVVYSRKTHDIEATLALADEFNFKPVIAGAQEAYQLADRLAERDIRVLLAPLTTGEMQGPERSDLCYNQAGILDQAGVQFCLTGEDLLAQARWAVRFGLDRERALQSITIRPAEILSIGDRAGKLAEGRSADFVVLDGEPLELTSATIEVVVAGRRTRRLKTED